MSEHPPLCPKTDMTVELISRSGIFRFTVGYHQFYNDLYIHDRQIIARYQACAWQDRANKWEELWQRCDDDGIREPKIRTAMYECFDIAKAWRAWEK